MGILFVLIPLSLMLLVVAVAVFFWAVRNGQFDDLDSPAYRILMDDDGPAPAEPPPGTAAAGRPEGDDGAERRG